MSSSELVPSKSTKMSSGFTICTSHVTGPPRMQENHEKSEDPKKTRANLLWVKKKMKHPVTLRGNESLHIPAVESFMLLLGRFPSGVPMKHPIEAKFSQGNFPLCGLSVVKWLSLFWEDPEIIAFDILRQFQG